MISLKSGDLVVLKSGGPVMTVDTVNTDIFDDNRVTGILCAWFIGDRLERARFDPAALAPAPPSDAPFEKAEGASREAGEYKTVLEEMVTAMNDGADASGIPRARTKPIASERPRRASVSGAGRGGMNRPAGTPGD
jgi:uncharacterized protein YodC (DUF2158 family)